MQYLFVITTIITIAFTSWASIPSFGYPLGGFSQADISNMYPSAITPASITFGIWSFIYFSWIIVSIFMMRKKFRVSQKIYLWYSLAIGLTGVWLIPWGYLHITLSLMVMLVIFGVLYSIFCMTRKSYSIMRYSVELFFGWIIIATLANITIWLSSLGFDAFVMSLGWGIGFLGFGFLIVNFFQFRYHSYGISLVFLWAMIGEYIAHSVFEQRLAVGIYFFITFLHIILSWRKKK